MCWVIAKTCVLLVTEVHEHKKPNWHYILRSVLESRTIFVRGVWMNVCRFCPFNSQRYCIVDGVELDLARLMVAIRLESKSMLC